MVSKRQTEDLSDSEHDSTPAKRARHSSPQDEEPTPEPSQTQPRLQGKGKARQTQETDNNDDSGTEIERNVRFEDPIDEDEQDAVKLEEKIRKQHIDQIRSEFRESANRRGRPGTLGIIQKIDLTNFMCHDRLTVDFGDQINFIIGQNGSGKSAILTALTVALGAKASITGRGSGVRNFIKEGKNFAEVEVKIKNVGPEAFKPDVFGDTITVARRFRKEGTSTYKLLDVHGKVGSTKREDLLAMCEQMQLQVDNPMNVLTQDSARQFLSGAHPREKYALFLKGTCLSQLADEYEVIRDNIAKTNRILVQKKGAIPDLTTKLEDAKMKVNEAAKAETQRQNVEILKGELAWAHVHAKEKELAEKFRAINKAKSDLGKINTKTSEAKVTVETCEARVNELQSAGDSEDELNRFTTRRQEVVTQIKQNKSEIMMAKDDQRKMNREIEALDQQIAGLEAKIQEETEKLKEDRQGKHAEMISKLNQLDGDIKEEQEQAAELQQRLGESGKARDKTLALETETKINMETLRNYVSSHDQTLQDYASHAQHELSRYGRNLPTVLDVIRKESWTGRVPLGPLGKYVELRDASWAPTIKIQLGQMMFSFVVENSADRAKLQKILRDHGSGHITVIVSKCDIFDYRHGEPPSEFLTALRVLKISEPWIERVLINSNRIERIPLDDKRSDGQNTLRTLVNSHHFNGGAAWTKDGFIVRDFGDGGMNTVLMGKLNENDPRGYLFPTGEAEANIELTRNEKAGAEAQLLEAAATLQRCTSDARKYQQILNACNLEIAKLRTAISLHQSERTALQEDLNMDSPVNIAALQEAKDEAEEQKRSLVNQYAPVAERLAAITDRNSILITERDELKKKIEEVEARKLNLAGTLEKAITELLQSQKNQVHWETQHAKISDKIKTLEEESQTIQKEFLGWTETASLNFEKVEKPRSVEKLTKELDLIKAKLAEGDRIRGYTLEQARFEFLEVDKKLKAAKKDIKEMGSFVRNLHGSLKNRQNRWNYFRGSASVKTKEFFQFLLSQRGFSGTLDINHAKTELNLKVRTDDQVGAGGRDKDPRALSGGEKSYATICLLLALWKSLECPIRCLDEFDVFMDSINRTVSMKLMVEQATSANEKQHILITPQEMGSLKLGPAVTIKKLRPPERNQGVLTA